MTRAAGDLCKKWSDHQRRSQCTVTAITGIDKYANKTWVRCLTKDFTLINFVSHLTKKIVHDKIQTALTTRSNFFLSSLLLHKFFLSFTGSKNYSLYSLNKKNKYIGININKVGTDLAITLFLEVDKLNYIRRLHFCAITLRTYFKATSNTQRTQLSDTDQLPQCHQTVPRHNIIYIWQNTMQMWKITGLTIEAYSTAPWTFEMYLQTLSAKHDDSVT